MSFSDLYGTDRKAETDGTWVDIADGVSVMVRRANSKKSREIRKRLEKPYLSMIRRDTLPDNIQEQITARHVAEGILINWKGVTDEKNKELPFTTENAYDICMKYPDFRDDVINFSVEAGTFRNRVVEEARGNS
jgi:hypothetical protein